MADLLPTNFPEPGETVIASYAYDDIAEGTGTVSFYLCRSYTVGGDNKYFLTKIPMEGVGAAGFSSTTYVDFDLSAFNFPQIIEGTAHFTAEARNTAGDGTVTAKIVKYDGTTETVIGAESVTQGLSDGELFNMDFTIAQTNFKRGDILRLKVKLSAITIFISVDPTETAPAGYNVARLHVPFKIDS